MHQNNHPMNQEKFDSLFKNSNVFKGIDNTGGIWHYKPDDIIIDWLFAYRGHPRDFEENLERLQVKVFPANQLTQGIPTIPMSSERLVLVNADESAPDYAFTFLFSIDSKNRKVKVKIQDFPEIEDYQISEKERQGIEIAY